jgi:divalent metal cation (Fe/Co/Zn/Cd) transporter
LHAITRLRAAGLGGFPEKILHAEPARYVVVNYIVLGASIVFEAGSWFVAFREFRHQRGRLGWLEAVRRSKDPTVFTVLFEDSAALIGLVIALIGIALAEILEMPRFDGIASLGVGVVLAATAAFLAYESQSLLTGEAVHPEVRAEIERIAKDGTRRRRHQSSADHVFRPARGAGRAQPRFR